MLDLMAIFGNKYRVVNEAEEGQPAKYALLCKYGKVYSEQNEESQEVLAYYGSSRAFHRSANKYPHLVEENLTVVQKEHDKVKFTFLVVNFKKVKKIIRPLTNRHISPEHKEKLRKAVVEYWSKKRESKDQVVVLNPVLVQETHVQEPGQSGTVQP